jgi:hypothetical protein
MSEFVHGKKNDYDVLKNVDCSIGPCYRVVIDASAFRILSPNETNRVALENRYKSKSYSGSSAKCHCRPTCDTEGFLGENAEIEK